MSGNARASGPRDEPSRRRASSYGVSHHYLTRVSALFFGSPEARCRSRSSQSGGSLPEPVKGLIGFGIRFQAVGVSDGVAMLGL